MVRKYLPVILVLLTGMFIYGCDKESSTQGPAEMPTQEDQTTAAEEFGPAIAGEDEGFLGMSGSPAGSPGTMASPTDSGDPCGKKDSSYVHRGLTVNSNWTFYSADSVAHEVYDSSSTVRISHSLSVDGSLETPRRTATIHQSSFLNIIGVTPSDVEVVYNGGGNRSVESTFQSTAFGVRKSYSGRYEWRVNGLVFSRNRIAEPWPLRGNIVVHATRNKSIETPGGTRSSTVTMDYTITFDGSQFAECYFPDGFKIWVNLVTGLCVTIRP